MTLSVTKHSYMVRNIEDLEDVVNEAVKPPGRKTWTCVGGCSKGCFLASYEYKEQ